MIPVVWVSYHDTCRPREQWDSGLLQRLFAGDAWRAPGWPEFFDANDGTAHTSWHWTGKGAVVVIPGQHHANDEDYARLNRDMGSLEWVLLIVMGDEASLFEHGAIRHPNMRRWIMTPRPGAPAHEAFFIGEGWKIDTPELAAAPEKISKPVDVFFSGQINNDQRRAMLKATRNIHPGAAVDIATTRGFAQGVPREAFLDRLAMSKIALCPHGARTADTFRLYEALEAGCVPVADTPGYWRTLFPRARPPFPIVDDWHDLPDAVEWIMPIWEGVAAKSSSWWQRRKREMAHRLIADLDALGALEKDMDGFNDLRDVTVLIPTSPIPEHPSTGLIEQTVNSVRHHLPNAEILILCDGVRAEQDHRAGDYHAYLRRLTLLCEHEWFNVVPVIFDTHQHQANMTRAALEMVTTPQILFVEHDTPLVTDEPIQWAELSEAIKQDVADVVRFHYEAGIHPEHEHLMIDRRPQTIWGAPLMRTVQWSQRPHLAGADYYRKILAKHFPPNGRTMIEDKMHSVAADRPGLNRIYIYAPEGNIKRSLHTDGRGEDPKFEMEYGSWD